MQLDVDHIRQLVIEELAGSISEGDAAFLRQITAENLEARALYKQLHQELNTPQMQEGREMLVYDLPAEKMLAVIKRKKRIRYIVNAASAAVVLMAAAGLYTVFRPGNVQEEVLVKAPGQQRIELQLSNGKTVDLSVEKQQVQVGNLTLNNTQKTLTYLSDGSTPAGWATLNVPAGKDYKVRLSDGTEVWLNAATRLQFPFNFDDKKREVTINGEAYLKVARNTQPFIVHLPHSTVQVLGTAFNVNTYDSGQIRVALVEGAVQMHAQGNTKVLKPGFEINYNRDKGMHVAPFEKAEVLSWQWGLFLFDDTPLEAVCKVIPRWFGITVVMDNREVAQRHFTGSIDRNKPLRTSLEHLKATGLIDYYFDTDSILHIK